MPSLLIREVRKRGHAAPKTAVVQHPENSPGRRLPECRRFIVDITHWPVEPDEEPPVTHVNIAGSFLENRAG